MLAGRDSILERHAANPGFRALMVRADAADGPAVAGFTYGFRGAPGQWWHDMVASALASTYPRSASTWLADSFEVAELHVLPAYQGAGIGRRLLLELTAGRPERTAVLSTQDTESRARRLYRGVGFTDLLTGFRFSGAEPPYAVMGATLPLRATPSPDTALDGMLPGGTGPRSPKPSSW
jgi:ribosomal protein S18 acetylase RimI-like enzyme